MHKRDLASSNPISTRLDMISSHAINNNSNKRLEHNVNRHVRQGFIPNLSNDKRYHGQRSSDVSSFSSSHWTDNHMWSHFGTQSSAQFYESKSSAINYAKFSRTARLEPHTSQNLSECSNSTSLASSSSFDVFYSTADNFDSSVAISQDNESNTILPMLNSIEYSTATESSIQHHDSKLTDDQLFYPLHSTELPTIVKRHNLAKDLRKTGQMQDSMVATFNNDTLVANGNANSTSLASSLSSQANYLTAQSFNSSLTTSQFNGWNSTPEVLNSTMYSIATESSMSYNSELTSEQSNYPLNSTELPTMVRMGNVIKNLKDVGLDQRTMRNNDTHVRPTRLYPSNGKNHNGKSIEQLPPARNFDLPLKISRDSKLNSASRMQNFTKTSARQSSDPFNTAMIVETPSLRNHPQNTGPSNSSSNEKYRKRSHKLNVSVPLVAPPSSQVSQNPVISTEPKMMKWLEELKRYWCKIENETKSSLQLIKQDLAQEGLPFDDKFERRFLRTTYERISGAYKQFLLNQRCFDEFFNDTTINTDTSEQNHAKLAASYNCDVHDNESVDTFIRRQNQRSIAVVRQSQASNHDQLTANSSHQRDSIGQSKNDSEDQQSASQFSQLPKSTSYCYCNPDDRTEKRTDILTNHLVSSSNAPQRTELNLNGEQQLPLITGELDNSQHSKTIMTNNVNDVITVDPDDDLEMTLTNGDAANSHDDQLIQPVTLSDTIVQVNPVKSAVEGDHVRGFKDYKRRQAIAVEPATSKNMSAEQFPETIDLISNGDDAVNNGKNGGLVNDIRTHADGQPLQCVICKKRFTQNQSLDSHMKTHGEMFAFQCSKCRYGFSDETEWKLHESRCKSQGCVCHLCKRVFSRNEYLVNHMQEHIGGQLRCAICRKKFKSNISLAIHMEMHEKPFPYQCSKCDQGFTSQKLFKQHESGYKSKQYECHLCNKKFYQQKSLLVVHMRSEHTGEMPFGCSQCPERFYQRSRLTTHTKRFHKKKNNK